MRHVQLSSFSVGTEQQEVNHLRLLADSPRELHSRHESLQWLRLRATQDRVYVKLAFCCIRNFAWQHIRKLFETRAILLLI